MKFEDETQNLRARMTIIQGVVIAILVVLGVDQGILRERFEQMRSQPASEPVTIKEGATHADIAWVESHMLEFPMLSVREQPQRRYPDNGVLAHVLGYVGEIGPEQLKQEKYKDYTENPYHPG